MKRTRRNSIIVLITLVVLLIISIQPVDYTVFTEQDYFKKTQSHIQSLNFDPVKENFTTGWSKSSITPEKPVRLTGLRFNPYESIADSIWIKTFIIASKEDTIALITYDLWIIHPHLSKYLQNEIKNRIPSINAIYFSATHTHSSIGGWASGALGQLIVGGNHEETLEFIGDQTISSLKKSISNLEETIISYGRASTYGLVVNRLDRENGPVDSFIRYLLFEHKSGKKAIYSTFSAHTVFLSKDKNNLSADYPGLFLLKMQQADSLDLASFAAGAMGSHTPIIENRDDSYTAMELYSGKLAEFYINSTPDSQDSMLNVNFQTIPVSIPSPQFRISENWRLRPWIFEGLLGTTSASITCLQLGNVLMVGLPIELSGEFYQDLESKAQKKGFHLMITTFNGTYLGYAPRNTYYNEVKKAETRSMNWYGPYSGEYFSSLIEEIIHRL